MHSWSAAWTLPFTALLVAGAAHADPSESSTSDWLEWSRSDDTCPDAEAFVAKVEKHLRRSPALAAAESQRRLVARIEREVSEPLRWSAAVEVLDMAGTIVGSRRIAKTSDACGPVADALALVSALVLSQQALAAPELPQVQSLPPEPAVVPTATAPVLTSKVTPVTPAPRWSLAVDGGLAVGLGLLPGLNLGGEARLLLASPAWPALYTSVALWSETTKNIGTDRGVTLNLWTAGLGACPMDSRSPSWRIALCVGADVGRLRAHGFGFASTATEEQWLMEVTAGGQIQRRLGRRFSAAIGLDLVIPLMSGRIAYAGSAGESLEVWRRWPVAGVGSLRLGYAFW